MGKYAESAEWADIEPLPQNDGPGQPLAAIMYPEDYSEAMSYLRAILTQQETSERVLELTSYIIRLNPAHYTVWLYRAKTIFALSKPVRDEIDWLNPIALKHLKNYQIWNHRQTMIDALNDPTGEQDFIQSMFDRDSKNYHVWSYRQWLVQRFALWDQGEYEAVDELLAKDVRNNSAWNHRWFLNFGGKERGDRLSDRAVVGSEVEYAKQAISLAPQNASPWNYIRGLSRQANGPAAVPLPSLQSFAEEYATLDNPDAIRSSHALELLADVYAEEQRSEDAGKALDLLASRFDPIRANYWRWKREKLHVPTAVK